MIIGNNKGSKCSYEGLRIYLERYKLKDNFKHSRKYKNKQL